MKRLLKVFFALIILLVSAGTLGLLSQLVEIPWVSLQVNWLLSNYAWTYYYFSGTLIVLGACLVFFLLVVLTTSGSRKRLVIKEGKQKIEIRKSALTALVEGAYSDTIHPDKTQLTIKIKGNKKVVVHVQVNVRSQEQYQLLATTMKEKIEGVLSNALEQINSQVTVYLREKDPIETTTFGKKQSRVI